MKLENLSDNDLIVDASGTFAIVHGNEAVTVAGTHFTLEEFDPQFCLRLGNDVNVENLVDNVESCELPCVGVGYKGLAVGIAQLCLNYKGYYDKNEKSNIDFDFGVKTHKALYDFIHDNYLDTETVTTPEVWRLLLKEL